MTENYLHTRRKQANFPERYTYKQARIAKVRRPAYTYETDLFFTDIDTHKQAWIATVEDTYVKTHTKYIYFPEREMHKQARIAKVERPVYICETDLFCTERDIHKQVQITKVKETYLHTQMKHIFRKETYIDRLASQKWG